MRDIIDRTDVSFLIDTFYKKVVTDKIIGSFFTDVIKLDWDRHIPVMIDFWETVLFGGYKYKGNPMLVHMELHKKKALKAEHFERWTKLWAQTIQDHFEGKIASKAIERANTVSQVIMMRIKQLKIDRFNIGNI